MRLDHIELAHLELLLRSADNLRTGQQAELQEIREHLQECAECSDLAETYSLLLQEGLPIDIHSPIECPSEETWLEMAAGLLPDERCSSLLAHAKYCDMCGKRLKAAVEDVGPSTPDEELAALDSSNPAWQQNLANRLTTMYRAERPPKLALGHRFRWQLVFPVAIAALLLVAVTLLGLRQYRLRSYDALLVSNDALLASAYNRDRRTELRFYGGNVVPRTSPTRGAPDVARSIGLDTLQLRADEYLEKNPKDAYWHQVLGRMALLRKNGEEALQKFETAKALNANLSGLKFDLASAYFEIGEAKREESKSANGSDQYAEAANLYGQVIDDPSEVERRPLAYFNLALSWERLSNYCRAVHYYEVALTFEKDPSWRRDILRRIEEAKPKCQKSEGSGYLHLDKSPTAFLRVERSDPEQAQADYEIYLDYASRDWLRDRASKLEAEAALQQLAAIGLIHHDAWLRDFLQSPKNDLSREATDQLANSLQASALGDADDALAAATDALRLYQKAGNVAGVLRARVEIVYSLQRMGRSDACLSVAIPLAQDKQLERDSWLNSYLILETAICHAARGDWVTYTQGIRRSLALSRTNGLHLQVLREQGLLVESLNTLGQTKAAWVLAGDGLEDCIRTNCPPMRVYQFLQSLYGVMQTEGLQWAAANIAEAAGDISTLVANVQIRAYAQEVLGTAETTVGHTTSANEAFSKASTLLRSIPPGRAASLYGADWEADRSLLLEREGLVSTALLRLKQVEPEIRATDNYDVRQRYYTQFASLLLHEKRPAEALNRVLFAIKDAERSLSGARSETQKLSWERINRRSYLLLVQSLVEMDKPQEALKVWEWYRSAPYRAATDVSEFHYAALGLPPLPNIRADQHGKLTLVVARLQDFYVVWSVTNSRKDPIRMMEISTEPTRIADMAHTLTELCSNRDSAESDIHVLGQLLYNALLSPFDNQIQQTSILLLDLDSSLQRLPFAALTRAGDHYLNDTHALIFLPGWWVLQPRAPDTIPPMSDALVVEGSASVPRSGSSVPAATLPAEYLESDEVAAKFSRVRLIRSAQDSTFLLQKLLPQSEVFHFSGHTLRLGEQSGLLLKYPDTIFTASSLSGISLSRCRLAVLATCSSAGQTDYGMDDSSNLAHALLAAGASNVVATLWDVDSRASRIMMLRFYESISRSLSVSASVRTAQQTLRSDSSTSHPFFWSSMQVFSR